MDSANFVIGNMAWNAGLVALAVFLGKRWMDRVDKSLEDHRNELRNDAEHLVAKLDSINTELKTANGRVAKIEGKIEVQRAVCEERHGRIEA